MPPIPRAACIAMILIAMVHAPAAAALAHAPPPARHVLTFFELPDALASGDAFAGATIVRVIAPLRALVVDARDARALEAAALADARVRSIERDADAVRIAAEPVDALWPEQHGARLVRAPEAWDAGFGTSALQLCSLDTGVRASHEELTGARWLGGIDLVTPDVDAGDDHGHGTLTAGIAVAAANNGAGVAGIAQAGLLAAKVLRADGAGPWSAVAAGIVWCVESGADVVLMSFAGAAGSPLAQAAVAYAHARGVLLVAAAGNGACEGCVGFPATYPEVVAVTCVDAEARACASSSTGPEAELAAPGVDVIGPASDADDAYAWGTGTSFSAAHVAGAALLAWSIEPRLTSGEVRAILSCAAQDLGAPGRDPLHGHGLVDAAASVEAARAGGCGRPG